MKFLYVATNFTAITHTFITREVDQLQQAGHTVDLLSVRTHTKQESAARPECHISQVRRIYPVSVVRIIGSVTRTLFTRPGRLFTTVSLILNSREDSPATRLKMLYQLAVATCHSGEVAAGNYDRIHAHFASSPATFALFLHLLTGVPFSFTGHAADIFRESSALKAKLEHAAGVVAISKYNHDYYNTIVPRLKTSRIHCGIDPEGFEFRHRNQPGSPLRILSVGRSVPKKGFPYLLEALRMVTDAGIGWTCDIAGGGPLEDSLREQADRLALANLKLHGPLQQERIRELLDQADVFVLPCIIAEDGDRDNIPVSLMEAMAVGCPVISTDVAGIPELIGEKGQFGIVARQRDARSIADAIIALAGDHQLYSALSRDGRLQVEREFDVRESAALLLEFFSDLGHDHPEPIDLT